ncbi:MAG: energy transducer TonB [Bacteroidota bacterium]
MSFLVSLHQNVSTSAPRRRAWALGVVLMVAMAATGATAQVADSVTVHDVVETAPVLVGGFAGLAQRVVYPPEAAADSIEGRVYVQFVVSAEGAVSDVSCPRSPDERLCAAATEAIEGSVFEPGLLGGEPVAARTVLPVNFRLPTPRYPSLSQLQTLTARRTLNPSSRPCRRSEGEIVETSPVLIGGLARLQQRVQYPEGMRRAGVEGTVFVQFVVDENGLVLEPTCTQAPTHELCQASIAGVMASRFEPGTQGGCPVKIRYTLPVVFRLR